MDKCPGGSHHTIQGVKPRWKYKLEVTPSQEVIATESVSATCPPLLPAIGSQRDYFCCADMILGSFVLDHLNEHQNNAAKEEEQIFNV
jgi:hypothetical protein